MREFSESWRVWRENYIPDWEAAGPDAEFDLHAGQSPLLPRGWVHNPYVADTGEGSVRLTFAIRERTPVWLAEKLIAGAIEEPAFRRIILPGEISGAALAERVHETRDALVRFLAALDVAELALLVRQAAVTELEYTT
ncbi:hypothetical protein ACFV94_21545 [Streptomyces sp. NPDC059896]|uniref:hypothetical protein n=1 Tax=Streptomyces sp. NPDC059896 TaxID=3346993 RepID=UPI003656177E